jgi:hypothetical protein
MKALTTKILTKILAFGFVALLAGPAQAAIQNSAIQAKAKHITKHHTKHSRNFRNVEVWCGAESSTEQARFPYMASINTVNTKRGTYKVARVFKKGRVVAQQFVFKNQKSNQLIYEASGDSFSLTLNDNARLNPEGDFKAVIQDPQDGSKYIANGAMSCHRSNRS